MSSRRPVLLIPIAQHFTIRYLVLTGLLDRLAEHFECVLALAWRDSELEEELESKGVRCVSLPEFVPGRAYRVIRNWMISMREADMQSPTPAIDRRRMRAIECSPRLRLYHARNRFRYATGRAVAAVEPLRRGMESLEDVAFWRDGVCQRLTKFIQEISPSLVLSITPFISSEAALCRVAQAFGARTVAAILSFDNLTSRGKIETVFHHYGVWNSTMKQEAIRIYRVRDDQVDIIGAPQMDFYVRRELVYDPKEFFQSHRLDARRPVILFAAGPAHISPVEPQILIDLDQIVENYEPQKRPQILLRPHPVDDARRWSDALCKCTNVHVAKSWTVRDCRAGRIRLDDIRELASALAYTDVHVSTSSTMSLDGAIFDKPQIGLAYDPGPGGRFGKVMAELYQREHYLPLTHSGGIEIVRSRQDLEASLSAYLRHSPRDSSARRVMVKNLLGVPMGSATDAAFATVLRFARREGILRTKRESSSQPPMLVTI
jgi:hypothetical protein